MSRSFNRTLGISLPQLLIERIDASLKGGQARSALIAELITEALNARENGVKDE